MDGSRTFLFNKKYHQSMIDNYDRDIIVVTVADRY